MNTLRIPLLAVVAFAPFAHALDASAWKFRQPVEAKPGALAALDIPDATLDAARPDLADLRLTDASGIEIPYILDYARFVDVREGTRTVVAKNFVARLEGNATVLTFETGLTEAVDGVDLSTPAPAFLKPVRVEASDDGANWTTVAEGLPIFRQKNGAENLRVNFPAVARKFLRVTVDDAKDDPAPFTGASVRGVTTTLRAAADERSSVPVRIVSRTEKPGVTELRLDLGAANLPLAAITFGTPEPIFTRRVAVSVHRETETGTERVFLSRGSIWNLAGAGGESSSNKRLAMETQVPGREITVLIFNGDSPPLALPDITADRRPRRLVFTAPAGPVMLISGNPAAPAPRYDLGLLAAKIKTAGAATAAAGPLNPNPGYRAPVAILPPVLAGASIDTRNWGARKPVTLAAPGGQRLELDAGTLAFARVDLADLRLVKNGKQIPYLLDYHTDSTHKFQVTAKPDATNRKPGVTRLMIELPAGSHRMLSLDCRAATPVFSRRVRLLLETSDVRDGRRSVEIASRTWTRPVGDTDDLFELHLTETALKQKISGPLFLEIEDAGGAPIILSDFHIHYPKAELIFATADTAPVWLYYDNPEAPAPRYADLELVAGKLRAATPNLVKTGPEERLLSISGSAAKRYSGLILWASLAAVVAGLLFAVSKMLPKGEPR